MINKDPKIEGDSELELLKEKYLLAAIKKITAVIDKGVSSFQSSDCETVLSRTFEEKMRLHLQWVKSCVDLGSDVIGLRAVFKGQDLSGKKFEKVDMRGVDFLEANLENTSFTDCNLRHAAFDHATCTDSVFVRCDLRGVDFSSTSTQGTRFTECVDEGNK